jgi:chromosomal replication initiation ATPase DnaA
MPSYTFESFVVDAASRAAFDAAVATAEGAGGARNPLVIVGPTRSGKTHLLYAIEAAMRARGVNVLRMPTQDLVDRMVDAIRRDEMDQFRRSLAVIDALLLDDFWLGDKEITMRELLYQLGALLLRGTQIVLTTHVSMSRFPQLAQWLEARGVEPVAIEEARTPQPR